MVNHDLQVFIQRKYFVTLSLLGHLRGYLPWSLASSMYAPGVYSKYPVCWLICTVNGWDKQATRLSINMLTLHLSPLPITPGVPPGWQWSVRWGSVKALWLLKQASPHYYSFCLLAFYLKI